MKICDKQIFVAFFDSDKQIFDTLNVINRFLERFSIAINRFLNFSKFLKKLLTMIRNYNRIRLNKALEVALLS